MKTKTKNLKTDKNFDAVKFQRAVREKISKETEGMSFTELKEYFRKKSIRKK